MLVKLDVCKTALKNAGLINNLKYHIVYFPDADKNVVTDEFWINPKHVIYGLNGKLRKET